MRFREYRMLIDRYNISTIDRDPELVNLEYDFVPGARIRFSLPKQMKFPYKHEPSFSSRQIDVKSLADFAEKYLKGWHYETGHPEEEDFFASHYVEIFCGKYPEWVAYDIDISSTGYIISYVNTRTLHDDWPCKCYITTGRTFYGRGIVAEVIYHNRVKEKYDIVGDHTVVEYDDKVRRMYEFEEDEKLGGSINGMTAFVREYARL